MDIKSMGAPAMGERGLTRLVNWTRPKRFTAEHTTFDMGYEQAKRDLLALLQAEVDVNGIQDKAEREARERAHEQADQEEGRLARELRIRRDPPSKLVADPTRKPKTKTPKWWKR